MATLEALQKRIKTTADLRDIVSTMKSLSSVSILQYDQAAKSLKTYRKNIQDGFHALLKFRAVPSISGTQTKNGKTMVIVIGTDSGLVGRFNKEALLKAQSVLMEQGIKNALFMTIGKRMAILAENAGLDVFAKYSISNSIKFVNSLAGTMIVRLYEAMQKHKVSRVMVFYHKREQGVSVSLEQMDLLPF